MEECSKACRGDLPALWPYSKPIFIAGKICHEDEGGDDNGFHRSGSISHKPQVRPVRTRLDKN